MFPRATGDGEVGSRLSHSKKLSEILRRVVTCRMHIPHYENLLRGQTCCVAAFAFWAAHKSVCRGVFHILQLRNPFEIIWRVIRFVSILVIDLFSIRTSPEKRFRYKAMDVSGRLFAAVLEADKQITVWLSRWPQYSAYSCSFSRRGATNSSEVAHLVPIFKSHDWFPGLHAGILPYQELEVKPIKGTA